MPTILGVVNVTRDSFSDGGRFLDPGAAIAHAQELAVDGADIIDLGAQATNPDAEQLDEAEETRRVLAVLPALKARGLTVSVDTFRPAVMTAALDAGADLINDVTGVRTPGALAVLARAAVRVIVMHSTTSGPRAAPTWTDPAMIVSRVRSFFEERLSTLAAGGIARERIILDPGLGFFLGTNPEASVAVLRGLPELAALGRPLCLGVSRKFFVGALLDGPAQPRSVAERSAGTLAAELWAAHHGVAYLRTHDVRALRDGLRVWHALESQ
jgi:dihydropteroate synthase